MGVVRGAVFHHGGVPENGPLVLIGVLPLLIAMPNITGRLGCRTMETNGGSTLLALLASPRFVLRLLGVATGSLKKGKAVAARVRNKRGQGKRPCSGRQIP